MQPIEDLLKSGIHEGVFPGACYAIGKDGELTTGSVGHHTYGPDSPKVSSKTI